MLNKDYTAKLLNLEDVIITDVKNLSNEVHISLQLPRKAHVCPACGAVTDRIHDYRMQTIKDVPLARNTFLHLRKRRYRCACGKRFFEENTFLPRYYRITSRLVSEIIHAFERATGVKVNYKIVGRRAGDIEKVWADTTLANKELGWKAATPIEDTMRNAWKWQQSLKQ